ncbi:MAG: CRISPR-associated helicase Cas3' [Betaproteobacteria bacterium]|nr:CRISPR-associated helicase Cas3' [Betaproteobacteria bacterium]
MGGEKRLSDHIRDDLDAFHALFGDPTHPSALAADWLRFFRLEPSHLAAFWANSAAAIALHDLGKANDGFQRAVRRLGEQVIRHEHLSVLVIAMPDVERWLGSVSFLDVDLVLSAVLGHHLKASRGDLARGMGECRIVVFPGDNAEVQGIFQRLAQQFGLPNPVFTLPPLWSLEGRGESIPEHAERLERRFAKLECALRRDEPRRRLMRAVKAAVIVADSAGSGFAREGYDIPGWIGGLFDPARRLDGAYIERHILGPRKSQIEARHGDVFHYHGFQNQAALQPARTLMIAPCGAGKTLAAWRWIEAQLAERPRGRVIFLYPTRATATEGFRDYVAHAPESDASLLTGTAAYELRDMFANPSDTRNGVDYLTEARLYALGYWNKRLFSATVDQFLAFMQQCYKGLCLLPVLADAVVVFDEVHSFDVGLFDAFLKFLHHFDLPVLAMTASLPNGRRRLLEAEGLHLYTGAEQADLTANSELERYKVKAVANAAAAEAAVRAALAQGDNVLWVVNTVDRAQALAQRLHDLDPICYHSRFTLDDRKDRHQQVIAVFQSKGAKGRLAITTQVCEMSLDLDARLLVSEHAPIPSLIQRMGRCNRHARPGANDPGQVLLYPGESDIPYKPGEMESVSPFITEIAGKLVSQAHLERLLEKFTRGQGSESDRWAAFLDDGPWSSDSHCEELRDGDDRSVQAVLDIAVDAFLTGQRRHEPTDGFILPVPRQFGATDDRLPRYLRRASASHYDPALGFLKQPLSAAQGGGQ